MESKIIVLIISLLIIPVVSFFTIKRGYKACSDMLFMCFLYLCVLVFFYFTYGVSIEKKVINEQVDIITNNLVSFFSEIGIKLKPLPEYDIDKEESNQTIKNNNLKKKVLILVCCLFLLTFIISITIWILNNLKNPYYGLDKYGKNVVIKNIILILIVVSVQMLFSTFIIKNVLPLDTNKVINILVDAILN